MHCAWLSLVLCRSRIYTYIKRRLQSFAPIGDTTALYPPLTRAVVVVVGGWGGGWNQPRVRFSYITKNGWAQGHQILSSLFFANFYTSGQIFKFGLGHLRPPDSVNWDMRVRPWPSPEPTVFWEMILKLCMWYESMDFKNVNIWVFRNWWPKVR